MGAKKMVTLCDVLREFDEAVALAALKLAIILSLMIDLRSLENCRGDFFRLGNLRHVLRQGF